MEIILKNYELLNHKLNLTIPSNSLVGITGSKKDELALALNLNFLNKGSFFLGDNKVTKENIKVFRKRVGLSPSNIDKTFYSSTIKEYLTTMIKLKELTFTDTAKKLKDSLKIVGLPVSYLNKFIKDLSNLERKLLLIASILLENPNIIILQEPFLVIDLINEKKIMTLLLKLQDKYQKTIILISKDTTSLYKYTKETIIISDTNVIVGKTEDIYKDIDLLKKNKVEVPPILEFTHLARTKKDIKIDYYKDIRDIIKDIYKHV